MKKSNGKWMTLFLLLILLISCSTSCQKKTDKKISNSEFTFSVPEVPLVLKTSDQKIDFLMDHYWDNFNFSDTTSQSRFKVAEQAFADFVNILTSVSPPKVDKAMQVLVQKAGTNPKMLLFFQELGEKYLYDPNSPVRNEPLYCSFLRSFLQSDVIGDDWKIRAGMQYELAQKNKVGTKALDFKYNLQDGSESRLYTIKSPFLLLFFHNPGCTDCTIQREKILASEVMNKLQKEGLLKVFSLYPDQDLAEWKKYYAELPHSWINGYDKNGIIKNKEVYDLKAIPSLYLLNDQKIVLMKDARFEEIEVFLSNQK